MTGHRCRTSREVKTSTIDLYRGAIVIFFLLFLGAGIALVIIVVQAENDKRVWNNEKKEWEKEREKLVQDEVCLTDGCVQAAATISSSIDTSVDPCDNFYDYTCGSWEKKRRIPDDKAILDNFSGFAETVLINVNGLLGEETSQSEPEAIRKARDAFKSCMDTDTIEDRGIQPAVDFISALGQWPVLDPTWADTGFDLVALLTTHAQYNSFPIIKATVDVNSMDPGKHILEIRQPPLGMPDRSYYLEAEHESKLEAYRQLAINTAVLFGAERNTADSQMTEMVNFEVQLANISRPVDELYDVKSNFHEMTLKDLDQNYSIPYFNWKQFLSGLLGSPEINVTVNDTQPIAFFSPNPSQDFIASLPPVMSSVFKRTITNYVMWRTMKSTLPLLNKEARDIHQEYSQVVSGNLAAPARWLHCTGSISEEMGDAVGRIYIHEYFSPESKNLALELVGLLNATFHETLENLDWMDNATKAVAKEKASAMIAEIGYDDRSLNDKLLNQKYKDVTINSSLYFENSWSISRGRFLSTARKLHMDVDLREWPYPLAPPLFDAAYYPQKNTIYFPAGILIPPLFKHDQLQALNFGGIGMAIGHEITHGFDSIGRSYDKTGKLSDWWSQEADDKFAQKAQCVINQYNNFTIPETDGKTVNGAYTQGENVADIGGLSEAFKAYRKWVESYGREERKLPGLDATPDQLFFVNFAQIWCEKVRPTEAERRRLLYPHSPGRFRVIGAVQNSEAFAEVYNCPKGSPMNPVNKCIVW